MASGRGVDSSASWSVASKDNPFDGTEWVVELECGMDYAHAQEQMGGP